MEPDIAIHHPYESLSSTPEDITEAIVENNTPAIQSSLGVVFLVNGI